MIENQRNPCFQHSMMMMTIRNVFLFSYYLSEYTNCMSTEKQDALPNECPGYEINNLSVLDMTLTIVMLEFGECRVPLYCYCSQVHSSPEL